MNERIKEALDSGQFNCNINIKTSQKFIDNSFGKFIKPILKQYKQYNNEEIITNEIMKNLHNDFSIYKYMTAEYEIANNFIINIHLLDFSNIIKNTNGKYNQKQWDSIETFGSFEELINDLIYARIYEGATLNFLEKYYKRNIEEIIEDNFNFDITTNLKSNDIKQMLI